jgi:hypothetical protein
MATGILGPGRAQVEAKTLRRDRWWLLPTTTFVVFMAFIVYATWRAFDNANYYSAPYLSPFYSPCLTHDCLGNVGSAGSFGQSWSWWQFSPALVVLIFPLGFRLTCYYYRKAYYRAFWMSPPACAVAEPHKGYSGETRLPLILQNIHRYFWYFGAIVNAVLTYDVVIAFRNSKLQWGHMGLGTLIMLLNVLFLWLYTLGCHSCRHLVGGRLRHFSKHPVRYRLWTWVSMLNRNHARWAWVSLFSVALTDLYIYFLANGTFSDPRFF